MDKKDKKNKQKKVDITRNFKLWVLLDNTAFAVARNRDLELKHYGLTPAQAAILYTLENNNGQATQNEISQLTMRQHHSVSTLINRMVDRGLVEKVQLPNGSGSLVSITKKGRNIYANTNRSSVEMIFSVLSEEEREQYAIFLKRLLKKARNLLGIDYKPPFLLSND